MKGLIYQLKSVRKDKFCIMSFLLPIVLAIALNFIDFIDFSSMEEYHFGVVTDDMASETEQWLMRYGTVTFYQTREELVLAVDDPSTNLIGVEMDGNSIRTLISGDELALWRKTAGTLPSLYEQRDTAAQVNVQVLERPAVPEGNQYLFIAMTLIIAMFMGCTFNTMSIISEKEEGVALINEVLPMTSRQYVIQKIFIGFVFGSLSAVISAAICFRIPLAGMAVMLALIVLSAFVSALIGLFIGRISNGMMEGVVYIKIIMILFMAIPLLKYMALTENKVISYILYLIPSSASFEGIMDLAYGSMATAGRDIAILSGHCVVWFLGYLLIFRRKKRYG